MRNILSQAVSLQAMEFLKTGAYFANLAGTNLEDIGGEEDCTLYPEEIPGQFEKGCYCGRLRPRRWPST
jgi:hypothetical protein